MNDILNLRNNHILRNMTFALYAVVILYIIYMNLTPLGGTIDYRIDIGSDSDMKKGSAYLAGPAERVTIPTTEDATNYRNLTSSLVYFNVPSNKVSKNSEIEVKIRYKAYPEDMKILLGAKDSEEWHFRYATINDPALKYLEGYNYLGGCNGTHIYSTEYARFDCKDLLGSISAAIFPGEVVLMKGVDKTAALAKDVKSDKDTIFFNYTLRGDHTFYTYISDNAFDLKIEKYDSNSYNGSDVLNIRIYGPDNNLFANETIDDDSITENTAKSGPVRNESYHFDALPGTYRIVLDDLSNGADVRIKSIKISSGKLVFEKQIFTLDPSEFYTRSALPSKISFQTYHDSDLQNITIDGQKTLVEKRATVYDVNLFDGGHTITIPKGDIIIASDNYFSPSKDSYFEPYTPVLRDYDTYMKLTEKSNADPRYILMKEQYNPPQKDGDWIISTIKFDPEGLYTKNNEIAFMFNIPNIENRTVSIDWIETKITVPPIWQR